MPARLRRSRLGGRYIAAFIATHCAFLPLLTFLLPSRVEALSANPVHDVSILLVVGGITASIANIFAGTLSDAVHRRSGSRQPMALGGLAATSFALSSFALANSLLALTVALIFFQLALNFLLAPLVAVLVDHVPDRRKGVTAAWLNLAVPIGTLATSATVLAATWIDRWIFPALAVTVILLTIPFMRSWPSLAARREGRPTGETPLAEPRASDFLLAWVARFGIQFGAAVVLSYLYLYLGQFGSGPDFARSRLAEITLWATPIAIVAGVTIGRLSDRARRRRPALIGLSLSLSVAFATLVLAQTTFAVTIGFALFLAALTVFLALDGALVAQLLKASSRRGWALGWMNLTNTLPAIFAPLVTIGFALSSPGSQTIRFSLVLAAAGALCSALCIARIRAVR